MSENPEISFRKYGSGPENLILIHGYCETREMWVDFIPLLSDLKDSHSIYAVDLPGFGDSPLRKETNNLYDVAASLKKFCEGQNIEIANWIGHSLGGYVLMHLLSLKAGLIKKLCFFHSSIFADTADKKDQRNKTISFIKKNGLEEFVKNFIPNLFYEERRKFLASEIKKSIELAESCSKDNMVQYMQMMRDREDLSHLLSKTEIPVHFIIGENDQSVPLSISNRQLNIPKNSSALVLEQCAHMGMFERPLECASSILNFIESKVSSD